MYVRLAFGVAAHLQSDILLVDEVLAVGDAIFQKKCLGKMNEVAKSEGRTILLVSHNRDAIRNLCTRSILFEDGSIVADGPTDEVIHTYNESIRQIEVGHNTAINNEAYRRGNGSIRFTKISVTDIKGDQKYLYSIGEKIYLQVSYQVYKPMLGLKLFVGLRSGTTRELVTSTDQLLSDSHLVPGNVGKIKLELTTKDLLPGEYPIYWHLSEINNVTTNIDVLDDLTPPLVLRSPGVKTQIGYFRMPSRIISKEINVKT
ncbi:MAG: ABC-type polysaccharide/polyol phosphate transport system, ATPase component [Microgenomates group bacterium GW2011_GWA2_46_16]|nr:MAG: ABC-type polysaccharide/polyol phosphate transport system, ATPase component [Microgenomates group bacterium GW2011_GWA2_46_16]